LLDISGNLLVVVVTRRIAGPDDKVDRVLEFVADPVEGGIDEGDGRVAVGCLGTVEACGTMTSVTRAVFVYGRVDLVEGIRMEVCRMASGQSVTCQVEQAGY
jgi:hypothetical protein